MIITQNTIELGTSNTELSCFIFTPLISPPNEPLHYVKWDQIVCTKISTPDPTFGDHPTSEHGESIFGGVRNSSVIP